MAFSNTSCFTVVFLHFIWGKGYLELVSYIYKTYSCSPGTIFGGTKNEGARDVWEFQRSCSRLLLSMVGCIIISEDTHAIIILDNCGLKSKLLEGTKNEGVKDVWEFQRPP